MNSPISSTWNHVSFLKTNKFTINAWGRLFRECLFKGSFKCLLYFVQIFLIFFIHSSISNSKSFLIATFYRPPINSTYLPSNFDNIFNDQLSNASCEKKEIIVLGDFNTDLLKKDNKTIKDTFKLNGFTQLIKRATRITKDTETLIDLIATNNPSVISCTEVLPTSLSDHDMVCCLRKLNNRV